MEAGCSSLLACPPRRHRNTIAPPSHNPPCPFVHPPVQPPGRIAKSKQATAAGAAVAKGVATGMQAATVEIGTSLMSVATAGDKKGAGAGGAGGSGGGGVMQQPAVKAVGGVGMEILRVRLELLCFQAVAISNSAGGRGVAASPPCALSWSTLPLPIPLLRAPCGPPGRTAQHKQTAATRPHKTPCNAAQDIAAVRDAMVGAVGTAWSGLKEATVDVFDHQYGAQAAAVAQDSCEVVEGVANMGLAMKMTQPTQVLLTSAKESEAAGGGANGSGAAAAGAADSVSSICLFACVSREGGEVLACRRRPAVAHVHTVHTATQTQLCDTQNNNSATRKRYTCNKHKHTLLCPTGQARRREGRLRKGARAPQGREGGARQEGGGRGDGRQRRRAEARTVWAAVCVWRQLGARWPPPRGRALLYLLCRASWCPLIQ